MTEVSILTIHKPPFVNLRNEIQVPSQAIRLHQHKIVSNKNNMPTLDPNWRTAASIPRRNPISAKHPGEGHRGRTILTIVPFLTEYETTWLSGPNQIFIAGFLTLSLRSSSGMSAALRVMRYAISPVGFGLS